MNHQPNHHSPEDNSGLALQLARVKKEHKSLIFFAGLIFAILSYLLTKPTENACLILQIFERLSWILLFLSGLILLAKICEFQPIIPENIEKMSKVVQKRPELLQQPISSFINFITNSIDSTTRHWTLFTTGMSFTLLSRIFF